MLTAGSTQTREKLPCSQQRPATHKIPSRGTYSGTPPQQRGSLFSASSYPPSQLTNTPFFLLRKNNKKTLIWSLGLSLATASCLSYF